MPATIHVERDHEGVQAALFELLEEALQRGLIEGVSSCCPLDPRALSPGYYTRAAYLFELAAFIEHGVTFDAIALSRDDARGLMAVARARAKFDGEHPYCHSCGYRLASRLAPSCTRCGQRTRVGEA